MKRKLLVVLLVLGFMLGFVSGFWSKPAQASTEEKRRECVCAAEPWSDEDWNKPTPPPSSDQNPANSSTSSVKSGNKPELPRFQQKPQRSLCSRLQLLLFNLRLFLGSK
jgi:hypothetical protein